MKVAAVAADRGKRLDSLLHERLPEYSRSRLQSWIRASRVLVDGAVARSSHVIRGTEEISLDPAALPELRAQPEDISLSVLYEDSDVVAIDKPAGMVVHAGAGVHQGTLVNALLHRFQALSSLGGELRPGIVHRLDRFTSGVLLVAKNDRAHQLLAAQFASRQVRKIYLAMVHGRVASASGRIETPIARDPKRRERMTARLSTGRAAWSEYQVLERYPDRTFLQVLIGTGRTHQIRVHLSSIGHVIVGDRLYGAPESSLGRYFLHAHRIEFESPATAQRVTVESPLPPGLKAWKDAAGHAV